MLYKLRSLLSDISLKAAWMWAFLLTSVIVVLVQFILLPYVFPTWHAGYGLLAGGDSFSFHKAAVELSEIIKLEGWSAWELRPKGWMPAGVAGAIYVLTIPQPWTLIPLNAAIHATTYIIIVKILMFVVPHKSIALISAIPFAFFPSAMLWYTQIHRDGYQILGTMLFLLGFLILVIGEENDWLQNVLGLFSTVAGVFIVWLARPHSVVIILYMFLLMIIIVFIFFLISVLKGRASLPGSILKITLLTIIFLGMTPLTQTDGAFKYTSDFSDETAVQTAKVGQSDIDALTEYRWVRLPWIPSAVDRQLYSIAYLRAITYQKSYGETASGIDYDRTFHSGHDFIKYFPRALQIGFFAPFPMDWLGEGKYESTTFFRKVSAFEMIFIYLSMPFLLYGLWIWRKKIQMWLIVTFCTIMMMPLVYSVPNVGTLYRYRYGYLMLLVGVGLLAAGKVIKEKFLLSHKNPQNK